jgi:hypothetical protein
LSMPARAAAARTTSHIHLGRHAISPHATGFVDRSEHPTLRNLTCRCPCVYAVFTHVGIRTVRTCTPLPTRSAITQCSSRCRIDSRLRANSSPRRSPQPINMATIAWSRNSRGVDEAARSSSRSRRQNGDPHRRAESQAVSSREKKARCRSRRNSEPGRTFRQRRASSLPHHDSKKARKNRAFSLAGERSGSIQPVRAGFPLREFALHTSVAQWL